MNEAKEIWIKLAVGGDIVEDDEDEYTEVNFYVHCPDLALAKQTVEAINEDDNYQDAVEEAAIEEIYRAGSPDGAYLNFIEAEIYEAKPPKGDFEIEYPDMDNFNGNIVATI